MLRHGIERLGVLLNRLRQHLSRCDVGFELDANRSLRTDILPSYGAGVICHLQRLRANLRGVEPLDPRTYPSQPTRGVGFPVTQ